MKGKIEPYFQTPDVELSREEVNKANSCGMRGTLRGELSSSRSDLSWEAEQIAKSYGIYLEFDRAKTGSEKDWMYMIRVTIPGGGPIPPDCWSVLDELSNKYTGSERNAPSLRLTTRQNIQFHWIKKADVVTVVQRLAQSGLSTLNGCGDNVRNIMACPLAKYSSLFDANAWAKEIASYFELPAAPFLEIFEIDPYYLRTPDSDEKRFDYKDKLLNRKFKMALATVHRDPLSGGYIFDNCVEARTNDVAMVPIVIEDRLVAFQIFIGGGQGERNGKATMAMLAEPFACVAPEHLLTVLDAIVAVHRDWGDRKNRHWARLKYVVRTMGVPWYFNEVKDRLGDILSKPDEHLDVGERLLHHGWCNHPEQEEYSFGAYIENGRIEDNDRNGRIKTAVVDLLHKYQLTATISPNQDLIFNGIQASARSQFERDLESYGYGKISGKPLSTLRRLSGACVGRDTCRLAYTDSEKLEPQLLQSLEQLGWGDLFTSIGITGCERQCYRPSTKAIGIVGTGLNLYQIRLMGTADGRHQGQAVVGEDGLTYLRNVPREHLVRVIDTLFRLYCEQRHSEDEEFGYFVRRVGLNAIIDRLKSSDINFLMEKTHPALQIDSSDTACHTG